MGRAKRRHQLSRQLNPNYGQPKMPDSLISIQNDFLNKQTDLVITSTGFLYPETYTRKNQFVIVPRSTDDNYERKLFADNQQKIIDSLTPLIRKHGSGWICQIYNHEEHYPEWIYVLATKKQFQILQTSIFTGEIGFLVTSIISCALREWSFSNDKILIPVIATSDKRDYPSWLFCI
ncbi:hypothetical protein [Nostoc sphaeroides]|uniref:Uncharacterized protein n=1 Tax=Nostoc sphaeroides CCNUC1 TaxID=2653204 RepID=A0A5P8WH54_9NOSO|nr:hypothetical protein [Nostoc sphaeroides]QFS51496.1 hypothetical protein GXM_08990 [Nostoc sphaeroides CCNUC1]